MGQELSLHAPREGCDGNTQCILIKYVGFQSTHPARGATELRGSPLVHDIISIHAPREGCDLRSSLWA